MADWWTYGLADFLMFSPATYWRLVERMNAGLWPGQLCALGAGTALLVLAARGRAFRLQAAVLAAAWGASGWLFHWQRYAQVFLGAPWLAAASALEAVLLLGLAARGPPGPGRVTSGRRACGLLLGAVAVIAFPAWTWASGQPLVRAEVFGLMPDPTALATLGWLLASVPPGRRWRWLLAVVPLLSLAVGLATRWSLAQ